MEIIFPYLFFIGFSYCHLHDVRKPVEGNRVHTLGIWRFSPFPDTLLPEFSTDFYLTITGNMPIIAIVVSDRHLHTPMYFFLGNLSILEAASSSNILPRMLSALQTGDRRISVSSCFAQWYFCSFFLVTECCLLCAMSYDRYLAVCNQLHYTTIMKTHTCIQLAAASWISGFTGIVTLLTLMLTQLNFCGPSVIDHYFCDLLPLRKLCAVTVQ